MSKALVPELCSECGYLFDRASGVDRGAAPKKGDISLCLNCGHPAIFSAGLTRREMTATEYNALSQKMKNLLARARRYCVRNQGTDLAGRGGRA